MKGDGNPESAMDVRYYGGMRQCKHVAMAANEARLPSEFHWLELPAQSNAGKRGVQPFGCFAARFSFNED